jgi:hypothetical protein
MMPLSRRALLSAPLLAAIPGSDAQTPGAPALDLQKVISAADLVYDRPVERSEEGLPVGNGRMGSLVWTTARQLRFQINRADVYANDSTSTSFFERHNDYCGGCAFFDIDFGGAAATFPESGFPQRLSLYSGQATVEGKDVTARIFGWPERDVIAIDVEDRRSAPGVSATLRMLRYETKYFGGDLEKFARDHVVMVERINHRAASRLVVEGNRIALTQDFREGAFCCKSAVAVAVVGRGAAARIVNETDVALETPSGAGKYTILVASAATFDPNHDVLAEVFANLDAAEAKGPANLAVETANWWRDFWSRGSLHLTSPDGEADFVERNYHYYLYLMAVTSRGKLPPKFNGMLWNTNGDLRTWGAQHWFANLSCYYEALPAANRFDLMEPMYAMYFGMLPAAETAARQQWGSQGMYIPETSYFNGLEKLPDDIASEMQDLYLRRKPWEQRSDRFLEFARTKHPHSSRWNWILSGSWKEGHWVIADRGAGPYGPVNHNFATTAKIAYWFWRRYEYTLDREWLRDRAYPMLRGSAEFYRHYPNVKMGDDGRYHIHWVNSNESVLGARDTDEDLSAMHGILPAAIRAAEILGVDEPLRTAWKDFHGKLPPLPTSEDPEALKPADYRGPRVFVRGLKPVVKGGGGIAPDANSLPMWFFDLCHTQSRDTQTLETARNTFTQFLRNGLTDKTPVSVLSKVPIAAASIGRADAVRLLVPNQIRALSPERATAYKNGGVLANRMTLREGPQALDAQRLGRAAEALHLALLQSAPPAPGEDPVIRLVPAWPAEWSADFQLLARGGFLVRASIRGGKPVFVELESQAGAECRIVNPFGGAVDVHRNGRRAERVGGDLLRLATVKGEKLRLQPAGRG